MIVNYAESGWQIITQRSHGLLAAQLCSHWKKDNQPERWVDTLIATAEHDDVYNEFENDDLINDKGGPVNFKATSFDQNYGQRLIDMAETKSAYIALLVAMHIRFVHGTEPKARTFLKGLEKLEKKWMIIAETNSGEVKRGYELLEFCDAFSLLICQGLIQPEDRKIEISKGPDGKAYEMHTQQGKLVVQPWPFELEEFDVTYESRTLSELRFRNTAHFKKSMSAAIAVTQRLTISKPRA